MKNKRLSYQKMKLATKISVILGAVLAVILIALSSFSILTAKSAVTTAIDGEFAGIAAQNGVMVQSIFDAAASTGADLTGYIERLYVESESWTAEQSAEKKRSAVYDTEIAAGNYDVEDYILNTAWSVVANNPDICGMGVFFEQGAFDSAVSDYTIYIDEAGAKSLATSSYGEPYSAYSQTDWYSVVKNQKSTYYTDPYLYEDITMISTAYPIMHNGAFQGTVMVDINVNNFSKIKTTDPKYPSMYVDIFTDENLILYDSESLDYIGDKTIDLLSAADNARIEEAQQAGTAFNIATKKNTGDFVERYYYPIDAKGEIWWASSILERSDLNKGVTNLTIWMLAMSALALVLVVIITSMLLLKMLKPIGSVVVAADKIANGILDVDLVAKTEDEIGVLTKTFANTVQKLKAVIEDISHVLTEMANGNLDVETNADYPGDFNGIKVSANLIVEKMNAVMLHIKDSANQVSEGSSQIAAGAQSLAEGATDQASSIEELQATVTDITAQVEKNAQDAKDANKMAEIAGTELQAGNEQMKQMLNAMDEINKSSDEIKKVILTIEDIAAQTNLLSLNASIEAARAGEAGRGFAVVADQVGKLATESTEATKISSSLIEASLKAVENGIKIATESAKTIDSSAGKVQEVVSSVSHISAASGTQAAALDQITQGVEQIASVIQENTAMSEESASASEELSAQAAELEALVSTFHMKA